MEDFIEFLANRRFQAYLVIGVLAASMLLMFLTVLRFVPVLGAHAVGANEPFWVLFLSEAALTVAALMGIPSLLAFFRADEIRDQNNGNH